MPVELDQLKQHLRIDHSERDDALTSLLLVAREQVEDDTWLGLTNVERTLVLPGFPCRSEGNFPGSDPKRFPLDAIYLPVSPLTEVASVTYYDSDGEAQEMDVEELLISMTSKPGMIRPPVGQNWPATQDRPDAVTITYSAGYEEADEVPESLKHAMLLIAAELDANAEPSPLSPSAGGTGTARTTLDRILEKYRVRCPYVST